MSELDEHLRDPKQGDLAMIRTPDREGGDRYSAWTFGTHRGPSGVIEGVWKSPWGTYLRPSAVGGMYPIRPAYALDYTNRDEMVRLFRCLLRAAHVDPTSIETWATPVEAALGALAFVEGDDPTEPPPEPQRLAVRVLDRREYEWAKRTDGRWINLNDSQEPPREWNFLHHRYGPVRAIDTDDDW